MRLHAATPLSELTEKQFASQVHELAKVLGWRRFHTYRSTRSEAGFPDETLVRERVVFLELKTETGKLSAAQKDWLRALLGACAEAYVVRPRDLEALSKVLTGRGRDFGALAEATRLELGLPP